MVNLNDKEQQIANILVQVAKEGRTVTFTEIMQRVGMSRKNLGKYLSHIGQKCLELGLPVITVLVVYKNNGRVGIGYNEFDSTFPDSSVNAEAEQKKVWDNQSWKALSERIVEYDAVWTNDIMVDEGDVIYTTRKTVLRDVALRKKCLQKNGSVCVVCGFDATKIYGKEFSGLIEVHHLFPVSAGKRTTSVDDLVPVCPNCHRALHFKSSTCPYTIKELQEIMNKP